MKLALDTNAYKALGEGEPHLAEEVRRAGLIGLPIVVMDELWFGFMNGSKLRENTDVPEQFLATPRVQVLQLGKHTNRIVGEIATLLRQSGIAIQQKRHLDRRPLQAARLRARHTGPRLSACVGLEVVEIPSAAHP